MGNLPSSVGDDEIQKAPKKVSPVYKCKVLLLGTGGSGKSTVWFQFEKLNNSVDLKLVNSQSLALRLNLFNYLIQAHSVLVKKEIPFCQNETKEFGKMLKDHITKSLTDENGGGLDLASAIKIVNILIREEKIMTCYNDYPNEFKFVDEIQYFLCEENTTRLLSLDYKPTFEDIISMRLKTTGIHSALIRVDDIEFAVTDVGVFDGTDVLAYLISLSDYDEMVWEDDTRNALIDAMETFEATVLGEWFTNVHILLIFNKEDVLLKKMKKEDRLKDLFPEYTGGQDFMKAKEFIKNLFLSKIENRKTVHVVEGHALSDEFIRKNFETVLQMAKELKQRGSLKQASMDRTKSVVSPLGSPKPQH